MHRLSHITAVRTWCSSLARRLVLIVNVFIYSAGSTDCMRPLLLNPSVLLCFSLNLCYCLATLYRVSELFFQLGLLPLRCTFPPSHDVDLYLHLPTTRPEHSSFKKSATYISLQQCSVQPVWRSLSCCQLPQPNQQTLMYLQVRGAAWGMALAMLALEQM